MGPPRTSELPDTESAPPPPPPPPPGGARTPSPTQIRTPSPQARTPPSPPSKRRRGRSTPPASPSNQAPPSSPRRRCFSTPPSPTRGEMTSYEDKSMASTSRSAPNKRNLRTKLDYSEDNGKEDEVSGPVAIFWDIENCSILKDTSPTDIYANVMKSLGMHKVFRGRLSKFCAYADFKLLPAKIRDGLQSSGIEIVHVPHKQNKDAADKVIIAEMLFFAIDNCVPSSILLISGDVDFSLALHGLRKRSYTVSVAIPSTIHVSSQLTSAAEIVWDWPSLARGSGVGMPKRLACPGDLQELKDEMIELLQATDDGAMLLSQIPGNYLKYLLRPLVIAHYGCSKLRDLLEKLGCDSFIFFGGGANMSVYLNKNFAPEKSEGSEHLGSSTEQASKVTDIGDLHEAQDTTVPTFVIDEDVVECTEDVHAPKKEEMVVEFVETVPISQATPVLEKKKKHRRRRR